MKSKSFFHEIEKWSNIKKILFIPVLMAVLCLVGYPASAGADRIYCYSTKQEAGYPWRVSGLLLHGIICLCILDRLVIVMRTRGHVAVTDFFDDWPDFRAGKLNKKAIAASKTAVMAF